MASIENIGGLQEKRRNALVNYCLGTVRTSNPKYAWLITPEDLSELLRLDTLDMPEVQNSRVAEATSCSQQFIHAAYRKLEPGYEKVDFASTPHLNEWQLASNYSTWTALQQIKVHTENFLDPHVRMGKTHLFKALETSLNQTSLTTDSTRAAVQTYLEAFAKVANLDMVSAWMEGSSPDKARYFFISRTRGDPCKYFWRMADIELDARDKVVNPAVWSECLEMEVPIEGQVLDVRPVFWNGQLCVVWAIWHPSVMPQREEDPFLPARLEIFLAFKRQDDQWSPPTELFSQEYKDDISPVGSRLIATVWSDYENPKGKLGVMLTNGDILKVYAVRDVFLRTLPHDDGTWLDDVALRRFTAGNQIQHPLLNQPKVIPADGLAGTLRPYLGLHATAFRVGNQDWLIVRGYCWETGLTGGDIELTLELKDPAGDDPPPLKISLSPAGGWNTESRVFKRAAGSWSKSAIVTFGGGAAGTKQFSLTVENLTRFDLATVFKNSRDAAQFLSLNQEELDLKYVRLNTLFVPELVRRANVSVDAVLDLSAQFLDDSPPDGKPIHEPGGPFYSANGRIFWELFFHLVHLVATRFRTENRFEEAQQWLHRLFDPQAPAVAASATEPARPRYWRCRMLDPDFVGNPASEIRDPLDPDAIAYGNPKHYAILVFCEYVKNLIEWGDSNYRQLTREGLTAARLCYIQAKFLMGKPPSVNSLNRWDAARLGDLVAGSQSRTKLEAFEKTLTLNRGDFPLATDASASSGLIGTEAFTAPVNETLVRLFNLPVERLYNLRRNLDLNGNPMDLAFFEPAADPKQLMRERLAGVAGAPRTIGGRVTVIAFHWRMSFDLAQRAVQLLQDLSNQTLSLLERRDAAELARMQQLHLVELGDFAHSLQMQSIEQVRMQLTALERSRAVAQQRADVYAQLYSQNVSTAEYRVMDQLDVSQKLSFVSSTINRVAAALDMAPNVFGVASGGIKWSSVTQSVATGLSYAAEAARLNADKDATTEAYRRRQFDWGIQRDQATLEVKALDAQIEAQKLAVRAAETQLQQTLQANRQALTIHNFLQKRATNDELFNWMLGQIKALNNQAYDAVSSLCIQTRNSMNAETGDYDSVSPLPMPSLDSRHGQTVAEHLRLWLLRLEQAYLSRQERRLELVRTVSLRQLFDDPLTRQPGIHSWAEAWGQLISKGTLDFCLTQLLFDRDYPGHYCRLISSVEVDFPVVKGAYQDTCATLLQISSKIATKPTAASVAHLHNPVSSVPPSDVQNNLRSGQSIALSVGLADNGMNAQKSDQGLLNFFECTGAVSCWQLKFPWWDKEPQAAMLKSLTDVIVRIRYTAKVGDEIFTRQVEDLVKAAPIPGTNKKSRGARGHA
jgi:hypothetical protein